MKNFFMIRHLKYSSNNSVGSYFKKTPNDNKYSSILKCNRTSAILHNKKISCCPIQLHSIQEQNPRENIEPRIF